MSKRKIIDANEFIDVSSGELDLVLAGLPSEDSKIKLYRIQQQGRPAYMQTFAIAEFSEEIIKNTYGGGRYKYVAVSDDAIVKQGIFDIDGEPLTPVKQVIKKYVPGKGVVLISDAEQQEIREQVRLQPASNADPIVNILLEEFRQLKNELKDLRRQEPTNQPRTTKDMVGELLMYRDLFQPQKAESPTAEFSKTLMDVFKQGIDAASTAENGGSPWIMILDKVLPTVQRALDAFSIAQQRATVSRPIQQPSNGAITMPNPPSIPATGFDSIADKLRAYLPTFLQAASNGTDPDVLIDLTLPQIPESDKVTVIGWLESKDWFNDLLKLHPMIQAQHAWWIAYHNGLLDGLKNPVSDDSIAD